MKKETLFTKSIPDLGTITIRAFDINKDSIILHNWVNKDYAVFWGMQNTSLKEVEEEYVKLMEPEHYDVFVGEFNNEIAFVLERYNPQKDSIANYYSSKSTDSGVHIIIAPPKLPKIDNFTWYMFQCIMDFVFSNKHIERILVEPDIRNKKMFALCQRIGFTLNKIVELPHKTAQLAFLNRQIYSKHIKLFTPSKRSAMNTLDNVVSPQQAIKHIQPKVWQQSNKLLVKKAICEFSHELLITPTLVSSLKNGWNQYLIKTDNETIEYRFEAKQLALNHLMINEETIVKTKSGVELELDAILFIKEFKSTLGIDNEKMPVYLEEIISTLYGSAFKIVKGNPSA